VSTAPLSHLQLEKRGLVRSRPWYHVPEFHRVLVEYRFDRPCWIAIQQRGRPL